MSIGREPRTRSSGLQLFEKLELTYAKYESPSSSKIPLRLLSDLNLIAASESFNS